MPAALIAAMPAAMVALAMAAGAATGCSRAKDKPPPPERDAAPAPGPPLLARPPARSPTPPPPPRAAATVAANRGLSPSYPVRQPLVLARGLDRAWPPIKVQALLPIPDRRLAAASGKFAPGTRLGRSDASPDAPADAPPDAPADARASNLHAGQPHGVSDVAVELIDIENGVILWRDTALCSGPVVHTSTDRVLCAGWKGTVALNVDNGRSAWSTPQIFRAAGDGYVVVRDASQVTVGAIMDVATGRTMTRVQMPEGHDLEAVRYLCADKVSFDLYSWSPAGDLRRFRLGRREEVADLVWTRRLEQEPARLSPCDQVVLVETPIPGVSARHLRALTRKKGAKLGGRVRQFGWWPSTSSAAQPGDIEVITDQGLELRDRRLGNIRPLGEKLTATQSSAPGAGGRARVTADRRPTDSQVGRQVGGQIGGHSVATWANLRMIRSVAGTALIIDEQGIRNWLAAPAHVGQAVLTPSHILAGPWADNPHSSAENLILYKLPGPGVSASPDGDRAPLAFAEAPTAPPPPPPITTATLKRMPKTETTAVATVAFPRAGEFEVAQVALADDQLYLSVRPAGGRSVRGLGLAVFDLGSRSWGWFRERACARDAVVVGIAITDRAVVCASRELFPGPGVLTAFDRQSGAPLWTARLPTLDRVLGADGTVIAIVGARAAVLDASTGEIVYELLSDNGHLPRVVLAGGLIIGVEAHPSGGPADSLEGLIVARQADGTPVWSNAIRGYISELRPMVGAVAVHTHAGKLFVIGARDGSVRPIDGKSLQWKDSGGGDLAFDSARGRQGELIMWAYDERGKERYRASYPTIIDWVPAPLRSKNPAAPVVLMSRQPQPRLLIIDPKSGDIDARHLAPSRAYRQSVFSTVVAGRPVVGMVLREGLAVQLY